MALATAPPPVLTPVMQASFGALIDASYDRWMRPLESSTSSMLANTVVLAKRGTPFQTMFACVAVAWKNTPLPAAARPGFQSSQHTAMRAGWLSISASESVKSQGLVAGGAPSQT